MTPLLAECAGLWRRTLLIEADGTRDAEPGVLWLQSLTAYVDSRGFAGTLHQEADVFEWHREFDVTTPGPHPDAGVMRWEGTFSSRPGSTNPTSSTGSATPARRVRPAPCACPDRPGRRHFWSGSEPCSAGPTGLGWCSAP